MNKLQNANRSLFLSLPVLGVLTECVKSMGCDVPTLRMHLKIKKGVKRRRFSYVKAPK